MREPLRFLVRCGDEPAEEREPELVGVGHGKIERQRTCRVRRRASGEGRDGVSKRITALVPWFGSNRTLAENVGKALAGCEWVGVPFAGGMCELRYITARTIVVSDLHRHVINLASILADGIEGPKLIRRLRRVPLHEEALIDAQGLCGEFDSLRNLQQCPPVTRARHASNYFISAWMGRNGMAGTDGEFKAGFSVRWETGGGDSATRYRSAVEALRDWRKIFPRCTFLVRDAFDFLADVKDRNGHGLYCDPPFPGPGDRYAHKFDESQQRRLAAELGSLTACRVVCRFYDVPFIRELYPEPEWTWHRFKGRKQSNAVGPEVLLVRNG